MSIITNPQVKEAVKGQSCHDMAQSMVTTESLYRMINPHAAPESIALAVGKSWIVWLSQQPGVVIPAELLASIDEATFNA